MTGRSLSLAAGTLPSLSAPETVRTAADAGFCLVGLRPDHDRLRSSDAAAVRTVLLQSGIEVLDVEVIKLGMTSVRVTDQLVDYAVAVGAAHVLVVSNDEDRSRTVEGFRHVCERSSGSGLRPVLEFMTFTTVPDLSTALAVVKAADHPLGAVLVDALHLARSGGTPTLLADVPASLLPYVQLCDAPADAPGGPSALVDEARHARLVPGAGDLPLTALLSAVPGAVVSVEVQSDKGWSTHSPVAWARATKLAAETVTNQVRMSGFQRLDRAAGPLSSERAVARPSPG